MPKIERFGVPIRWCQRNSGANEVHALEEAIQMALTDDEAAEWLVSRTPDAYRLAVFILRDGLAAEDAAQEAVLRAWDARGSLRRSRNHVAWFNTIVANVCRDEIRRNSRVRPLPGSGASGTDHPERLAARDEMERALRRLQPDEQVVLGLRFGRDLSVAQIAEAMGRPEGTVKSKLHHSLEHLRSALEAERRAEGRMK